MVLVVLVVHSTVVVPAVVTGGVVGTVAGLRCSRTAEGE